MLCRLVFWDTRKGYYAKIKLLKCESNITACCIQMYEVTCSEMSK